MSKRIRYKDEPMDLRVVADFLPPPEDLVLKEPRVKVSLEVTRTSLAFFKKQGARNRAPFRRMMSQLLDVYAAKYERGKRS